MTTPVTTTFESELAGSNPNNLFKAVGGIIYSAPMATAPPALFTSGVGSSLIKLAPPAWTQLGLIAKGDGVVFSRDQNTEEVESWGFQEPTRTDITSDARSAKFTLQETTRAVLELADFVDLSGVTPDATTGEVSYNSPVVPVLAYRRMVFIGVDGAGADRRYKIRFFPRAQVSGVDDETWSQSDATAYPVTVAAKVDTALGYAVRTVLAGPGQKARNAAQGFGS